MAGEGEEFDLIEYIRRELQIQFDEEVKERFNELLFGSRVPDMTESMRKIQEGFTGLAKAFEGFAPSVAAWNEIWHINERPEKFTPAEFNKLWDSFTHERKIEYVLSLIS